MYLFIKTSTLVIETGVLRGMVQSLYFKSLSGVKRGFLVVIPWASRIPSRTHPCKYGSFSSSCKSAFLTAEVADSSSRLSFWLTSGLLIMWKLATLKAHEVVIKPAATINCASSPSRAFDFSSSGRSLFSNLWKIVACLVSLCRSFDPERISSTLRPRS